MYIGIFLNCNWKKLKERITTVKHNSTYYSTEPCSHTVLGSAVLMVASTRVGEPSEWTHRHEQVIASPRKTVKTKKWWRSGWWCDGRAFHRKICAAS